MRAPIRGALAAAFIAGVLLVPAGRPGPLGLLGAVGAETLRAAEPTTVDDVSRLLMDPCPNCRGKQLSSCDCGEAEQMKDEIRGMLADGKTSDEIVAAYVKRYGPWIRSAPEKTGFNLVGYFLPFGLLLAGGGGLALYLRRAVRRRGRVPGGGTVFSGDAPARDAFGTGTHDPNGGAGSPAGLDPGERARLEAELRRLDD